VRSMFKKVTQMIEALFLVMPDASTNVQH
jgi:hypothetical protein